MNEKMEALRAILADTNPEALCVAAAVAEINSLEAIAEPMIILALTARTSGASPDFVAAFLDVLDSIADRIEALNEHLDTHATIATVEVPDDVSSLLD